MSSYGVVFRDPALENGATRSDYDSKCFALKGPVMFPACAAKSILRVHLLAATHHITTRMSAS